jgi:hypothetical protein
MKPRSNRLISLAIAVVAVGLYVSSLFNEAWYADGFEGGGTLTGLDCLLLPIRNPMTLLIPVWWANVLFVVGVVALCRNRRGVASLCGILGLLLGIACWPYSDSFFLRLFVPVFLNPLGSYSPYVGFYLWLGSMGILSCSVLPLLWPSD